MTTTLVRPTYFDVPAPTPPRGTLLDAATVHEGVGFLEPSGLFESYNCIDTDVKAVWPCPPVYTTPPVQSAASTATSGGTLAAGTYRAVVTALTARGETLPSNEISQVTTGATSTITFNWAAVTGATGYRIYVTAVGGGTGTETFLIERGVSTSYVWTGTPARGTTPPPTVSTAVADAAKTFTGPQWQDGIRFAVYGGVNCKGSGAWGDTEKLRAAFLAGESQGVERALMQTRFIAGSTWGAATDLTPAGGAVDPKVGLAMLENDAACKYAGAPTFHMPRGIAVLLSANGLLSYEGDQIRSVTGSKVAAGAGYGCPNNGPAGTQPAAGEQWIFGSGEVVLGRGDLLDQQVVNQTTNEMLTLVERPYVAAVDCYTAAVRVKVQ